MNQLALIAAFFLFVMGFVTAVCAWFVWRNKGLESAAAEASLKARPKGWQGLLVAALEWFGSMLPAVAMDPVAVRRNLLAAGHRTPSAQTIYYGIKAALAVLSGLVLGWMGIIVRENLAVGLVMATCGIGLGFLLPDRVLESQVRKRARAIERALPPALDLMVLSVEAGQSLEQTIVETGRELGDLYPDLCSEFIQTQLELRAGRSRSEVLQDLGNRSTSAELKKLAAVLIDTDRFGTSLGPALRTHAKYLRTRRKHEAQESARKLGVKLIFPVFFLVMPAVFVVTLGPAVLQIYRNLIPMLTGSN